MLTIDANVFVSAHSRAETNYAASNEFLNRVVLFATAIYCSTLILPETAAAVMRPTGRKSLVVAATAQIAGFPYLTLVELTADRARQAADIAVTCRLRGADAVYAAVAQEYGTTLVTWDQELLTRGTAAVPAQTPSGWLAANPN